MELAQLRTLIHVAELGSISRAADRLRVAQPALSRQIRLLEEELGGALFHRHGRGVTPTELGRRVLAPASAVLDGLDGIRRAAAAERASIAGRVRFGMTPTVAEIMSVPLAERLRDEQPDIALCLTSAYSGHLLDWLKRGEIDCCVSYDPEPGGSVRTTAILSETLLLVGDAAAGLAMARPVRVAALADHRLVLPSPAHGLRRIVDRCAARAGISLHPAIEADSFGAMIDLVRHGFGSTVLPLAPIHARLGHGELTAAPLVEPVPSRRVVLTYPADRPVAAATRCAGETFARIAAGLVRHGVWAGEVLNSGAGAAAGR